MFVSGDNLANKGKRSTAQKAGKQPSIRQDPDIQSLLSRLPRETALSLTDQQLQHLKVALGGGGWRKHRVDVRGTVPVPFYPASIYLVFLMGRNRRQLTRQEQETAFITGLTLILVFFAMSAMTGLLLLYLLKSALGVDIFSGVSLGIWDWFSGR